jgi:hypothetical protein
MNNDASVAGFGHSLRQDDIPKLTCSCGVNCPSWYDRRCLTEPGSATEQRGMMPLSAGAARRNGSAKVFHEATSQTSPRHRGHTLQRCDDRNDVRWGSLRLPVPCLTVFKCISEQNKPGWIPVYFFQPFVNTLQVELVLARKSSYLVPVLIFS